MKFQIQKAVLQEVLSSVISAVPNKATFQILNNFALRLEGNYLEVSATDLDLGIKVTEEVQGERDGAIIVNAKRLSEQIKNLVDPSISTISFDVQDFLTTIRWSERGKATITGFDASEFPPFPEVEDGTILHVSAAELKFLMDKTLFAVSTDSTRLALNGVFFEARDGKISMVATDGHRLGRAHIDQPEGSAVTLDHGVIIPPKVLQHVSRNISDDADVEIRISQTHVLFLSENVQVISKLIEGPYPKYENVIPANFDRTVQARTMELLNKIRCVISMANARTRQIRLQVEDSSLELSASDPEVGGFSNEELAVAHEGEGSFSIGFNGTFLSEILGMCKTEEVKLKMTTPTGACIIEPVGEGQNFSFLLMPLRLLDDN